ncbi:MAG TPA: GntR family transcriptional regulator [Desulfomonilia bacterium]|nr:GntR family transcriptional regulator [Desulfomonilia bacterium]
MPNTHSLTIDPNLLLRTQVYEFLRDKLKSESLKPGMFVSINYLARELGIGRTPLREALLQLQTEGFVTMYPQRGIRINAISEHDIMNIYEIMGALDSRVLLTVFPRITPEDIIEMKRINDEMLKTVADREPGRYFELNSEFHNIYLKYSLNEMILGQLNILRQRLFDFGSKGEWIEKVRMLNYTEHLTLIDLIEKHRVKEACDFIRDVHCCVNWE